jgi:TRAP-type mannitol/chloroaromatic compound transport system permease large subunit
MQDTSAPDAQAGSPLVGGLTILMVGALLVLVALGTVRAVEAAATAALAAVVHAVATGAWRRIGARVLDDAMTMTGAIFALLVAATTLSLVLRASGCDRLVAGGLAQLGGHPQAATLAVLSGLLVLAFVLDAFELVFLVVPIVMPPLLAQVHDAAWVSCLALLTLQAGFLLPPWGYAVVLVRAATPAPAPTVAALARPLVPYLGTLALVAAIVFSWPQITHWLRSAPERLDGPPATGERDVDDLIRSMGTPRDDAP